MKKKPPILSLLTAFLLNVGLGFLVPRLGRGTGRIERDIGLIIVVGFLAALAVGFSLRVLRRGEPGLAVLGLAFLMLPVFMLVNVVWWVLSNG